MCVPSEKTRYEVTFCPNCKSEKVETKWVAKYVKNEPKRVSMDTKIKTPLIQPSPFAYNIVSCNDCSVVEIPIQVVMSCQEYGYTVTKPIEQKREVTE